MKITDVKSHVLQYPLDKELGYSQGYFDRRTAHIVEVLTAEGIRGLGEAFGGGQVAFANKAIVKWVIRPMFLGEDPLDRERRWHEDKLRGNDENQKKGLFTTSSDLAGEEILPILGRKLKNG